MKINKIAPDFTLKDTNGMVHELGDHRGKIVIVNFWSCECPHSERADAILVDRVNTYQDDLVLLSVASNSNESIKALEKARVERRIPTVLIDADHAIADRYKAVTTPHIFVIDREGVLRYQGAVDDVTFRQREPKRVFLDEVIDLLLNGQFSPLTETPSYGCAIVREI